VANIPVVSLDVPHFLRALILLRTDVLVQNLQGSVMTGIIVPQVQNVGLAVAVVFGLVVN
jgi:hypothetical protein